jgi:hypothetical protein
MKTNAEKMATAVDRWIAEAGTMPQGAGRRALKARADWMARQLDELERVCVEDRKTPAHLEGLTASAMICAHGKLLTAVASMD